MARGPARTLRDAHTAASGRDLSPLRDYTAWGLRVRSVVSLPFASAARPGRPDVAVRFGKTPPRLPRAVRRNPPVWEAAPGLLLLHVEDVARYLVTDGREIVIEPRGGRHEDLETFLVGPVFAALLQQRGIVTLHAAAVGTDAGAALLLGASGSGKSSLAAALVERGYALLADHVTGVVLDAGGRATALPAFPYLRLWADSLDKLCLRTRARGRVRPELEKYWVPAERFGAAPAPVCAAFVLTGHHRPDFGFEPAPPGSAAAFRAFFDNTYRQPMLSALGQGPNHFRTATEAARRVPVVRVKRPAYRYPFRLATLADRIEAHLHDARTSAGTEAGAPFGARRRPPSRTTPFARLCTSAAPPAEDGLCRQAASDAGGASVPGAVWLASYPKSGNTWLRAVLTGYLHDKPASINALEGPWVSSSRHEFDEMTGLDSSDLTLDETARYLSRFRELLAEERFASRPGGGPEGLGRHVPAFIKTHEAYRVVGGVARFPRAGTAGVVYLVRNPLDVAVAWAYHLQLSIGATIRRMNDPAAVEAKFPSGIGRAFPSPFRTWSGHVSSWMDQADLGIHVARYEDLLKDPRAGFGAIVRFTGLAWDGPRLERAVEHASFPRLQAQERESGYVDKPRAVPSFFRAGVAGSWRTALTRAQVRTLVDAHGPVMERLGYLREAEGFLRGRGRRADDPVD